MICCWLVGMRGVWFTSNLLYIPLCFLSYSHIPHTARAFTLLSFSKLVFVFRNSYKKPSENCEPWYNSTSEWSWGWFSLFSAAPTYTDSSHNERQGGQAQGLDRVLQECDHQEGIVLCVPPRGQDVGSGPSRRGAGGRTLSTEQPRGKFSSYHRLQRYYTRDLLHPDCELQAAAPHHGLGELPGRAGYHGYRQLPQHRHAHITQ